MFCSMHLGHVDNKTAANWGERFAPILHHIWIQALYISTTKRRWSPRADTMAVSNPAFLAFSPSQVGPLTSECYTCGHFHSFPLETVELMACLIMWTRCARWERATINAAHPWAGARAPATRWCISHFCFTVYLWVSRFGFLTFMLVKMALTGSLWGNSWNWVSCYSLVNLTMTFLDMITSRTLVHSSEKCPTF